MSLLLELPRPQIVSLNLFEQFTQTKFGKEFHLSGFWVNAQLENIIIYRTSHNIQKKFEFWHRYQKDKPGLNRISFKLLFPEILIIPCFLNDDGKSDMFRVYFWDSSAFNPQIQKNVRSNLFCVKPWFIWTKDILGKYKN